MNRFEIEDYLSRGRDYDERGKHEKAIAEFNKALELHPNCAKAYNNRSGFLSKNFVEYPTACRGDENMHYAEGYKGDGKAPLSSKANGVAVACAAF
jgi:Tfp pilus assembly protein PilF